MYVDQIAQVAHEANRAVQAILADPRIPIAAPWEDFPEDQRAGVVAGVESALGGATPAELHDAWCREKLAAGWGWGPVKDAEQRTHPNLVPYDQLNEGEQAKDRLFHAIVEALAPGQHVAEEPPAGAVPAGQGHQVVLQGNGENGTLHIDGMEIRRVESASVAAEGGLPAQRVTVSFFTQNALVLPHGVSQQVPA